MVDTISQPGCAECGAGGLVLTDYRPYAFLRALLILEITLGLGGISFRIYRNLYLQRGTGSFYGLRPLK